MTVERFALELKLELLDLATGVPNANTREAIYIVAAALGRILERLGEDK